MGRFEKIMGPSIRPKCVSAFQRVPIDRFHKIVINKKAAPQDHKKFTFSFFDKIDLISAPDFVPNEQDILRSRASTLGIVELVFTIKNLELR